MHALLADDDAIMRHLIGTVLRDLGHEVTAVPDGRAAWERYRADPPPLVVLDWQMPHLDGLEVCRRIKAWEASGGAETFVLVVTSRDRPEDLARVLDAGADDYMSKPVSPEGLRARLTIAGRRIEDARRRRQAEAALARARWLAGIGETTLALQHEINNPLAALLGSAALLEEGLVQGAEIGETVDVIVSQARRIADVVRRLSALRDPRTVEYVQGSRMLDLRSDDEPR